MFAIGHIRSVFPLLAAAVSILGGQAAGAESLEAYPRLEGNLVIEIENDNTVHSHDPDAELNDLFHKTELGLGLHLTPVISVQATLVFEPVLDPEKDRVFKDNGLFAEELYFQVEPADGLRIYGGKFNPAFGTAWETAPGLYGADFAEDYEVTGRIGLGLEARLENTLLGTLVARSSIYRADTSFLSRSVMTRRGRTVLEDGGAGNHSGFESYHLALDGSDIPGLPGLSWHAAWRYHAQGESEDDITAEKAFVLGLNGENGLGDGMTLGWVAEYAHIGNADGQSRGRLNYYTLGASVDFGIYTIAASYTARSRNPAAGRADVTHHLASVSAGMEAWQGWSLEAGCRFHQEGHTQHHTIGVLLAREIAFGGS